MILLFITFGLACSSEEEITISLDNKSPEDSSLDSGLSFSPQVEGVGYVALASGESVSVDFVSGYFFYDQFVEQNKIVVASWDVECGDSFYSENSHSIMISFLSIDNNTQGNIIYTIDTFSSSIIQMVNLNLSDDINNLTTGNIIEGDFSADQTSGEVSIEIDGSFRLLHCGVL